MHQYRECVLFFNKDEIYFFRWMEAVLGEKLPPAAQLEEGLRNGVYLARLSHILTPEEVPLNRIYDREQKRYKIAGLQFRHTDNINYWIKSLKSANLPRVCISSINLVLSQCSVVL